MGDAAFSFLFHPIHMNGRIYDPKLGRMLQADPFVQSPTNSQSLNRYSYVLNNPLSYTDPSGYFSLSSVWKKWIRPIVSIAVMAVGMVFAPYLAPVWGALSGWIATGNLQGALVGAFSSIVFSGIGNAFASVQAANAARGIAGLTALQTGAKVLAHGIAGGIMSMMGGGKFGHGFASAGFTQSLGGRIGAIDAQNAGFSIQRTLVAAAVGGTASELTGGKFANGAITGAFSRAFNDEAHNVRGPKGYEQSRQGALDELLYGPQYNDATSDPYDGWMRRATITNGQSFTFTAGDTFMIEMGSHTQGIDSFFGEIDFRPLDGNGNLMQVATRVPYAPGISPNPTYSGGFGIVDRIMISAPFRSAFGFQWQVSIPPQAIRHNNSSGHFINIWTKQ